MDLSLRNTDFELMDDSKVKVDTLKKVFADINRSNRLLGGHKITIDAVWKLIKGNQKKSYTIYDLGCGDGAMLRELAIFLGKRKIDVSLRGVELRPEVLEIAQGKSANFPDICYEQGDILSPELYNRRADIVICTLTLHHFSDHQIPSILNGFMSMAQTGIVINDLHRSRISCFLFSFFRVFFVKTKIAWQDGMTSIKSGFKKRELVALSKNIPDVIHTIRWKWAFRYVWIIKIPRLN